MPKIEKDIFFLFEKFIKRLVDNVFFVRIPVVQVGLAARHPLRQPNRRGLLGIRNPHRLRDPHQLRKQLIGHVDLNFPAQAASLDTLSRDCSPFHIVLGGGGRQNDSVVSSPIKYAGSIVEYLDQGRLKAALVTREQERHLAVIDSAGHERLVPRDLVLMRHPDRRADRENVAEALAELEHERAELAAELDLELLWQVAQEQSRSFSAVELADLFFGRKSNAADSVMLEALLNDRTYFVRRHMDFVPRTPDQVERLRIQNARVRARSVDSRKIQKHLRDVPNGPERPPADEASALIEELS